MPKYEELKMYHTCRYQSRAYNCTKRLNTPCILAQEQCDQFRRKGLFGEDGW